MAKRCVPLPLLLILCGGALLCCGTGAAADEKEPAKPAKPPSIEDAATQAVDAQTAGDASALRVLGTLNQPDPWLVADELIRRRAFDAASAFARASPRPDVAALPEYVEARRAVPLDDAGRARLAAGNAALRARKPEDLLAQFGAVDPTPDSVVSVRVVHARALALGMLRRSKESEAAARLGATAARTLGWLTRASRMYAEAAASARRRSAWQETIELWTQKSEVDAAREDTMLVAAVQLAIASVHSARLGQYPEALSALQRAREIYETRKDDARLAATLTRIGNVHLRRGDYDDALQVYQGSLDIRTSRGDKAGVASTTGNIGLVHQAIGDYPVAISFQKRALELYTAIKDEAGVARTLMNLGISQEKLGDGVGARSFYTRAMEKFTSLRNKGGVATAEMNIATLEIGRGNYKTALALLGTARVAYESLGDRTALAKADLNSSIAHEKMGNYPEALASQQRAGEAFEGMGQKAEAAKALSQQSAIYERLGDYDLALSIQQRVFDRFEALGSKSGMAHSQLRIGLLHHAKDEFDEALEWLALALTAFDTLGERANVAATLGNIGRVREARGDYALALPFHRRALQQKRELGDAGGEARTGVNLGRVLAALGHTKEALEVLEDSVSAARALNAKPLVAYALRVMSRVYLEAGDNENALRSAETGRQEVGSLLGGLGELRAATVRGQQISLFAAGTLAAARLGRPDDALTFLESNRAGSLLEALGGREALRSSDLPVELQRTREQAEADVARASYDFKQARKSKLLGKARKARLALDKAEGALREVADSIRRDAKRQAQLFYPQAASADTISASLRPGEVLVVYGLCNEEALAVVLRQKSRRVVKLGQADAVTEACAALDARSADTEPAKALAKLRKLLVEPLGLGADTKQVLISPEGPLCYVPFGALLDRPVVLTPSGTTHVLLRNEKDPPGKHILALGDPDYDGVSAGAQAVYHRGKKLVRLTATRKEVEDIGDDVLVGGEANEERLREVLKQRARWRAVHFACHGLVDPKRPNLSSLALSNSKGADGFLTAREILRMEVPADLVVLSGCETGTGRIVKGEGIVGLTRSFMYAGAPRVICSLWKVDDAATQALMIEFYRVWGGEQGLSAAAALQAAMAHVRDQPKWAHPYHWAAWILWGLPD